MKSVLISLIFITALGGCGSGDRPVKVASRCWNLKNVGNGRYFLRNVDFIYIPQHNIYIPSASCYLTRLRGGDISKQVLLQLNEFKEKYYGEILGFRGDMVFTFADIEGRRDISINAESLSHIRRLSANDALTTMRRVRPSYQPPS